MTLTWTEEATEMAVMLRERQGLTIPQIADKLTARFGEVFSPSAVDWRMERLKRTGRVKPKAVGVPDAVANRMVDLWNNAGLSAAQIAPRLRSEFGGVWTRSAVLGKIHRLKQSGVQITARGRTAGNNPRPGRRPKVLKPVNGDAVMARLKARKQEKQKPPTKPSDDVTDLPLEHPSVKPISFDELDAAFQKCRWPIDDPDGGAQMYCGQKRMQRFWQPYCPFHAKTFRGKPPRVPAKPSRERP